MINKLDAAWWNRLVVSLLVFFVITLPLTLPLVANPAVLGQSFTGLIDPLLQNRGEYPVGLGWKWLHDVPSAVFLLIAAAAVQALLTFTVVGNAQRRKRAESRAWPFFTTLVCAIPLARALDVARKRLGKDESLIEVLWDVLTPLHSFLQLELLSQLATVVGVCAVAAASVLILHLDVVDLRELFARRLPRLALVHAQLVAWLKRHTHIEVGNHVEQESSAAKLKERIKNFRGPILLTAFWLLVWLTNHQQGSDTPAADSSSGRISWLSLGLLVTWSAAVGVAAFVDGAQRDRVTPFRAKNANLYVVTYLALTLALVGFAREVVFQGRVDLERSPPFGSMEAAQSAPQDPTPTGDGSRVAEERTAAAPIGGPAADLSSTAQHDSVAANAGGREAEGVWGTPRQYMIGLLGLLVWGFLFLYLQIRLRFDGRPMPERGAIFVLFRLFAESVATAFAAGLLLVTGLAMLFGLFVFPQLRGEPAYAVWLPELLGSNYTSFIVTAYGAYLGLISALSTGVAMYHPLARRATERAVTRFLRDMRGHTVLIGTNDFGVHVLRDQVNLHAARRGFTNHQSPGHRNELRRLLILPSLIEWYLAETAKHGGTDPTGPVTVKQMLVSTKLLVVTREGAGMLSIARLDSGLEVFVRLVHVPNSGNVPAETWIVLALVGEPSAGDIAKAGNFVSAAEIVSCVAEADMSARLFQMFRVTSAQVLEGKSTQLVVAQEDYIERNYRMKRAMLSNAVFFVPGARDTMAMAQRLVAEVRIARQPYDYFYPKRHTRVAIVTDGRHIFKLLDYFFALLRRDGIDELVEIELMVLTDALWDMSEPLSGRKLRRTLWVSKNGEAEFPADQEVKVLRVRGATFGNALWERARKKAKVKAESSLPDSAFQAATLLLPEVLGIAVSNDGRLLESVYEFVSWTRRVNRSRRDPQLGPTGSRGYHPGLVVMGRDGVRSELLSTLHDYNLNTGWFVRRGYPVNYIDSPREVADLVTGLSVAHEKSASRYGDKDARSLELNFCLVDQPGTYAALMNKLCFGGKQPLQRNGVPSYRLNMANIAIAKGDASALGSFDASLAPRTGRTIDSPLPRLEQSVRAAIWFAADRSAATDATSVSIADRVDALLRLEVDPINYQLPDFVEQVQHAEVKAQCPEIRRCPFTSAKTWLYNQRVSNSEESRELSGRLRVWDGVRSDAPGGGASGCCGGPRVGDQRLRHRARVEFAIDHAERAGSFAAILLNLRGLVPDYSGASNLSANHPIFNLTTAFTYPCSHTGYVYDKLYGSVSPIDSAAKEWYQELGRGESAPLHGLVVALEDGATGGDHWLTYLRELSAFLSHTYRASLDRGRYSVCRLVELTGQPPLLQTIFVLVRVQGTQDPRSAFEAMAARIGAGVGDPGGDGLDDRSRSRRDATSIWFAAWAVHRGLAMLTEV